MKYTTSTLRSVWGILFFFSSACLCFADGCLKISVHYNERPPYLQTTFDGAEGLTASPANLAFTKAGIPYEWLKTPSKRQMRLIEVNRGCDCLVGWFKNPEREKFAKYTRYIYQDKPQIAIARADNERLKSGMTVDKLFSDPVLVLKVKSGYSYGRFLDEKIAKYKPAIDTTTVENGTMLRIIHSKRADYFFVAPEEANELIKTSGLPKKDFKYVTFSNMPAGEKRYILCSEKVPDIVIDKLNSVITQDIHTGLK